MTGWRAWRLITCDGAPALASLAGSTVWRERRHACGRTPLYAFATRDDLSRGAVTGEVELLGDVHHDTPRIVRMQACEVIRLYVATMRDAPAVQQIADRWGVPLDTTDAIPWRPPTHMQLRRIDGAPAVIPA